MIKIVFVLPSFCLPVPNTKGGAVETLMTMLLNENEKQGKYEFVFISPDDEDRIERLKYSLVYRIDVNEASNETFGYDKKVAELCVKECPDYIIMEGEALRMKNCFDKVIDKRKLAIHLHSAIKRRGVFEEYFDNAIALSEYVANQWSRTHRAYIWKNAIDIDKFVKYQREEDILKLRNDLDISKNDFTVLFCGRIVPEKGIEELVSAFERMKHLSNIKLIVVGTEFFAKGNISDFAVSIVKRINNNNNMRYVGYVNNDELPLFYRTMCMQIIPSKWEEPAGLVAIEGMASCIPLVATNSGGLVEYVSPETVIIDKDNLVDEIEKSVINIYENYDKYKLIAKSNYEYAKQFSQQAYYSAVDGFVRYMEKDK